MTRRENAGERRAFGRRLAHAAVRVAVAAAMVGAAIVADVGLSSAADDETPYLGFGPPATGANGLYTMTVVYTGSFAIPPTTAGSNSVTPDYSLAGPNTAGCALSGGTVTDTGVGACTIAAIAYGDPDDNSNGGNSNGHEGPGNDPDTASASLTVTVTLGSQRISLTPESGLVGAALPLVPTGYSGNGAITYQLAAGSTAGGCSIKGSGLSATVSATSSGTCVVTATIAADSRYAGAVSAPATMTFTRKGQSISVVAASGNVGVPLTLVTSGSSGTGAITFALVSGGTASGCAVSGSSVSATGPGTCEVTASIAADSVYAAATSAPQAITFRTPPKGTLTVVASSETINVGDPVDETATVTGLYAGDSARVTAVTFTYTGTDNSYGPSTTAPSAPGTYTVTPSKATVVISPVGESSKYGPLAYSAGKLVINGQKLTVTASGGSITAGDSFHPTATASGLNSGDSASVTTVTFTYTGIGSTSYGPSAAVPSVSGAYAVTPSNATVAVSPSSHQSFYPPPYKYGSGTLIVTPKAIVIKVSPPKLPKPARTITLTVHPFAEGSYALTTKLRAQVMTLAKRVKSSKYRTVSLTGYTDNVFTPAFNVVLELDRAKAVSLQLSVDLTRLHVRGVVITVVPAPSIVLVATNTTAKGRAANRRVVATLRSS